MEKTTPEKNQSAPNLNEPKEHNSVQKFFSVSMPHINVDPLKEFLKPNPFSIEWIHGYNSKVDVINLTDKGNTIIFYAAVNCGVLYNWTTNTMRILQGHKNILTCIAADEKGKFLVTADSGPENSITIWDANTYIPHKTLFSPHGAFKIAKVAISSDAKYLLSISYSVGIVINWWIWSFGLDYPHATKTIDFSNGPVIAMGFNPVRSEQFLLMTKNTLWVGENQKIIINERGVLKVTEDYELKVVSVKSGDGDRDEFTCFTYVDHTSQILVGTSKGHILVFGYSLELYGLPQERNFEQLKFIKSLKLEGSSITVIKYVDMLVAIANKKGEIIFYDGQLKLIYWVHGFKTDSIMKLSFNLVPRTYQIVNTKSETTDEIDPFTGNRLQKIPKNYVQTDATVEHKQIIVRDFIIATKQLGIAFVDFTIEKYKIILEFKMFNTTALDVHPHKSLVSIGYFNGTIEQYDYKNHKIFAYLNLREHYKVVTEPDPESITNIVGTWKPTYIVTCLKYSPSGLHLVCGLNTGEIIFLDPVTVKVLPDGKFANSGNPITLMNFNSDSRKLAFADDAYTVFVYTYDCKIQTWSLLGKYRSHYKDITAVMFTTPHESLGVPEKLFSLGLDRMIVEYDLENCENESLNIRSIDRIFQTPLPLTAINWCPKVNVDPEECRNFVPMILIPNDEFKYILVNYETVMHLSTVLGPRFDQPVSKLQVINNTKGNKEDYILFATKKTIGIQKLPLDGNPWKHVGHLGHPTEIIEMAARSDEGYVFTIGSKDTCMIQWSVNYSAADTTHRQGGGFLDPYYCLIENGRPGWLFQEIRDLFYYIQILCQGNFSPAVRTVKEVIPIESLPDMMRALGFFPSEYEVENMLVDAKYKIYRYKAATEVTFDEFVLLYLNHRPAFGENYLKIKNAFKKLSDSSYSISREAFVDALRRYGENFTNELTWYLLSILYGHTFEDRAAMIPEDFSFLPEKITLDDFTSTILGMQDTDTQSEIYSNKGSLCSSSQYSSGGSSHSTLDYGL